MKLRRIRLENIRSFLDAEELLIDGDISIIIGPNGGGKTNLLDATITVLRRHLLQSWVVRQTGNPILKQFEINDQVNNLTLARHANAQPSRQQLIEIEIEVTTRDLENMRAMRSSSQRLIEYSSQNYSGGSMAGIANWGETTLSVGQRLTYTVLNNALQADQSPEATHFRQYLSVFEIDSRLRDDLKEGSLSTPMLSLPVNRAAGGFTSSVALSNFNEYDYKKSADAATSRSGSSLVAMAVGRIATKFRLLLEQDTGKAKELFDNDPQIQALTKALKRLGYDWELECVNVMQNQYDVKLTKQGTSFFVANASSGEKELLTYLFAIYALNVRDALIVIDEPELHLHPRWQTALLRLFEDLALDTGNQFLMATHSPVFVSPSSIQYVSRVFSKNQTSKIIRLNNTSLPDPKHLFAIINSQNNERIFFTDRVILVEGLSDRLFFEKALARRKQDGVSEVTNYEIVAIGGKGFFEAYRKILAACQIPSTLIADLDYASDIGPENIKRLFKVSSEKLKKDVIDNEKSFDAAALLSRMDDSLQTGNLTDLRDLWEYIKGRQKRLDSKIDESSRSALMAYLKDKRQEGIFILPGGDLESYLPIGYKSKDLDKLIEFLGNDSFWDALSIESRTELSEIILEVLTH